MPGTHAMLDGEQLPNDATGWFHLLERGLRGEWAVQHRGRDVHDAHHPAFRVAHVLIHIRDFTLQRALGRRIGSWGVMHDEPRVRASALDFYRLLPRFAGFEILAAALTQHTAMFDGLTVDVHGIRTDLGVILRESIDAQVRITPVEPISGAIRFDLLAGRGCAAFVRTITRDDPAFALQHARVIAAPHPMRRVVLRETMNRHGPSALEALDKALAGQ